MRVTVIDKKNLRAFNQLLGDNVGVGSPFERLKALNPHIVDFKAIEPGAVILLPDAPGFRDTDSVSVTSDPLSALSEQVLASVASNTARVRDGYAALLAEQKDVASVLKSAVVKRAMAADPELKGQIEAAGAVFKHDQQAAKDTEKALDTFQQQAEAELGALDKLLG